MFYSRKSVREAAALKLDVAHAHTPFSGGRLARTVARKSNIPLFYTSHNLYPEYAAHWLIEGNKFLPKIITKYLRGFANQCSGVIAPSLKMKILLESYGVSAPIFVLPTGFDVRKLKTTPLDTSEIRKRFGIPAKSEMLLYVGRLTPEKNVPFLFDTFVEISRKRSDAVFALAGEGYLKKELEEKAEKLGLKEKIIFIGRQPQEEVFNLYRIADIFVFASLTDTQGLTIMEAAFSGLPIVALKDECYSEMLTDGENGYVVYPYKNSLFAEKVIKILGDKKLCRRFSENSRKIVAGLTAESQAEKLLAIYRRFSKT